MPDWASREQIQAARRVNLYDFLQAVHPGDIKQEGNSVRLRCNHSVSIRRGYAGYKDFSTGETGNGVDCLVRYLGYSFQDAVTALCRFAAPALLTVQGTPQKGTGAVLSSQVVFAPPYTLETPQNATDAPQRPFVLPAPVTGQYRQLFAYLTQQRGIPAKVIQWLIDQELLYQEAEHSNMVFVDPARSFAEIRGTNSFKPFHQVMFDPATPAAFWWVKAKGLYSDADTAFVCESSIDAISLYCLHVSGQLPAPGNGLYCGIGGVANQSRIDAIKAGMAAAGLPAVLAVDNDKAGTDCCQRNPELPVLTPILKDWNEDWKAAIKKEG